MGKISGVTDVKNTIRGTNEPNTIIGGNLSDRLYGSAANDIIYGGAGNDYIYTGDGWDNVSGDAGDDTIIGNNSGDTYTIDIGEGNDTIIQGRDSFLMAAFITTATSGVFIKRGNDLIVAEGTVNLAGDADGDGDDTEDINTEIAGIQALTSTAAKRAGMNSIVRNLTNSVTIKNHFSTGEIIAFYYTTSWDSISIQTVMTSLVDYNTGAKIFNQAATNPDIVRGTGAADFITASKNNQRLLGGKGDDIYYIDARTDVVIEDTGHSGFWGDRVIFDDNNGGANVYAYTKEGNNLKIEFDDGSGAVVASAIIKNFYLRTNAQVERIGADDDGDISAGVAYDATSVAAICGNVAALTSAKKFLRGSVTNDQLTVVAGQRAYGLAGDDEYTVAAGNATIIDNAGTADILNADHVATETDGVFIKRGNDLIILDGGDAVTGYADADAAVADLVNLTNAQKRVVLRNLVQMTDVITVKSYFAAGNIETINAANNNEITDQEIITNTINYNNGKSAFNQHAATVKRLIGTGADDYIIANASNQKIYGKDGGDTYAIAGGLTNVEIYDMKGSLDIIKFTDADLNGADSYELTKSGNDLVISVTDAGDGDSSVIIKNHFLKDNNKIEQIEDFDGGTSDSVNSTYLYGSNGNDVLTISATNLAGGRIYANAGDDVLNGNLSNDRLYGGDGDDTLNGGSQYYNDYLYGQEGSDVYEILSGDQNDTIRDEDNDATPDTDKVVFLGADFSSATQSVTLTRYGATSLLITVDEGNGITSDAVLMNHYTAANQIEILEDGSGNTYNLATGATTGTINAAITFIGHNTQVDNYVGSHAGETIYGFGENDVLLGGNGNDTIYGGDGADVISGTAGNDFVNGGDGDDTLLIGGVDDDTIVGGLGDDLIDTEAGNGNDVVLYDLDSGEAAGSDTVQNFTIGEDIIRFSTTAIGSMATCYRDQIAIWAAADAGNSDLEIGYGWDEATQGYANTITLANYNTDSATGVSVIEFVDGTTTYALTDTEIEALLNEIVTNDNSADLTAVHDDGIDGAGQQLQMIIANW